MAEDRVALTQQIKEANDIVDVIGSYISLRPAGPTFKGVCPFHDDHRPSFDVDPRRQRYRCWACNQNGDVIKFVQEFVHVGFREALELLARRAGISLDSLKKSPHEPRRALMLDVARWADGQFQECLLESPLAEPARLYLGERKLLGETVRRFGLGFAPPSGDWLVQKAVAAKVSLEILALVGLIAPRNEGDGYYSRFRDRVIFPIRDARGQTVGFGGRILPSSPVAANGPKYYNSSETPLFSKSDQLYGIDQARQAAAKVGYLAIVEGYTDVMMAHQHGIQHVVATMGTALNARHVRSIRGTAPRVVLVFDADAGGNTGVDRALEVFVSQEMDLRIATLPDGLDPCDLLAARGPEPFREALEQAVDVLEYKLARLMKESASGIEGQRQAVERMLGILALGPQERSVKLELMVTRITQRLKLKEETVWTRLKELRGKRQGREASRRPSPTEEPPERTAPAAKHEIELLEALLADGTLVVQAIDQVSPAELEHPGLRLLLEGLYRLHAEGLTPDLDHLRGRLDNEKLLDKAEEFRDRGLAQPDRRGYLHSVLARIRERRQLRQRQQELKTQVQAAPDHVTARELLRKLQSNT
ncbi:MAG TPA: DNA primase [Gemmataceae bacterium]|nr:DNA primase [Gemmataceae bacterium]